MNKFLDRISRALFIFCYVGFAAAFVIFVIAGYKYYSMKKSQPTWERIHKIELKIADLKTYETNLLSDIITLSKFGKRYNCDSIVDIEVSKIHNTLDSIDQVTKPLISLSDSLMEQVKR